MIVGQNTILQCKVYGNPAPDVRWTKDGEAVNIADQRISVSFTGNTSSLTIVDVAQAEQGLYRCVANNSVNTTTSYPGILTVHCEYLRAASPKYEPDLEIAKKWIFFKLGQNEGLRALVTKILF